MCARNCLTLLPFLLDLPNLPGLDIDQRDLAGQTPLMLAAIHGVDLKSLTDRGADVNLQDFWGKSALMHAVIRGDDSAVSHLLACGGDPLSSDARGRDALYWAARGWGIDVFDRIFEAVKLRGETANSCFQRAIHSAMTTGRGDFARKLLDEIHPSDLVMLEDGDGWSPLYTARKYREPILSAMIILARGGSEEGLLPYSRKIPTEWHPRDRLLSLLRQPDARSISVDADSVALGSCKGIARANHPMSETKDNVYYFEVTIVKQGSNSSRFGVGFCEETSPLDTMLGCSSGSWGYRGDNGNIYEEYSTQNQYGPQYGEGDTIGCGVNFKEGIAFYTKNGFIIGKAFGGIRGRLYPAVCVDTSVAGCILSAQFWTDSMDATDKFKFQGPYDDEKTLRFPTDYPPANDVHDDNSSFLEGSVNHVFG